MENRLNFTPLINHHFLTVFDCQKNVLDLSLVVLRKILKYNRETPGINTLPTTLAVEDLGQML